MDIVLSLLPPIVNVIVTGLFAGVVLRQYLARRRIHQLYWSIALSMALIATVAYIFMLVYRPTSPVGIILFRSYYALGGAIMPAWLGLGSLALISKKKMMNLCFTFLCVLSLLAVILIFTASINRHKLSQIAGTPGTGTLLPGAWLALTIILNTLGVVAIAGVAVYSGWKLLRHQNSLGGTRTSTILWANILVLLGALLNASAGSLARFLNMQENFWLIMALGWIILLLGVLLTSRRGAKSKEVAMHKESIEEPIKIL